MSTFVRFCGTTFLYWEHLTGEVIPLDDNESAHRNIWSCAFCELPENDITAMENALCERSLPPVEDARLLHQFLALTGLTQSECAKRLGRSQPSVANRLRLLRLPGAVLDRLQSCGLSERHGRALLRLPDEAAQYIALGEFIRKNMNVVQAEEYVEDQLTRNKAKKPSEPAGILDGLKKELTQLRRRGVCTKAELKETEEEYILLLHLPRAKNFPDF